MNRMSQMNQLQFIIIDSKNNGDRTHFNINDKQIQYIKTLLCKLTTPKFIGYFKKTMSMYPRFKVKEITNTVEINDYFRRCNFLSILQIMAMISNSLPQYGDSIGLIKIGPSKNNKKNCCIIDDSTILDKDTEEIRDSLGNEEEPHRGHRFFYQLPFNQREDIILVFDYMLCELQYIFNKIVNNEYHLFDPIYMLQRIVYYCNKKKYYNIINYLAWEIHDSPHLLTMDEKFKLFIDYQSLYDLWNNNFITNNQGKLRIYIMCFYYLELLHKGNISE